MMQGLLPVGPTSSRYNYADSSALVFEPCVSHFHNPLVLYPLSRIPHPLQRARSANSGATDANLHSAARTGNVRSIRRRPRQPRCHRRAGTAGHAGTGVVGRGTRCFERIIGRFLKPIMSRSRTPDGDGTGPPLPQRLSLHCLRRRFPRLRFVKVHFALCTPAVYCI